MSVGRRVWADLRGKGSGAPSLSRVTDVFLMFMDQQYKGLDGKNKGAVSRGVGVGSQHTIGSRGLTGRKADHPTLYS